MAIVQSLACFDSPAAVARSIRKTFGVEITRQSIEAYDPTKAASRSISSDLTHLFWRVRADFLAEVSRIPIAHKAVRLRALDRMAAKSEAVGNMALAMHILEQAARETAD